MEEKYLNFLNKSKKVGLINNVTNFKKLNNFLNKKKISLYCGFDPTANSLHIGHLSLLVFIRKLLNIGHNPIFLIGGATALIGNPSFKRKKKNKTICEKIENYSLNIKKQIKDFFYDKNIIIVNNKYWLRKLNIVNFLTNVGKNCSTKFIDKFEDYRTFSDIFYILLQGYDFLYLNKKYNVNLQIGGSDQWKNILLGVKLINRIKRKQVFGLTTNLITDFNNVKISKTANNVIWLDKKMTTPYKLYQYLINVPDEKVYIFLKFLTFLDVNLIEDLESRHSYQKKKYAQYLLAEEVTNIVHGKNSLDLAIKITNFFFKNSPFNLTEKNFEYLVSSENVDVFHSKENINLKKLLILIKFSKSLTESKKIIKNSSIFINGFVQRNIEYILKKEDWIYNKYIIMKKGKKNIVLVKKIN
ncbi:MAG: tyrosine--tRNA ligase [Enterobacteriaceae bacterium]